MMQQALFEPAPQWPAGWSHGVVVDEQSPAVLGLRRRIIEYTHTSGAKLRTSQKWKLDTGEYTHTSFRVWLTEDVWQPAHWVDQWSPLERVRPGRSEDWDWLMRQTEPAELSEECPGPYGQWVFIRQLIEALRQREVGVC